MLPENLPAQHNLNPPQTCLLLLLLPRRAGGSGVDPALTRHGDAREMLILETLVFLRPQGIWSWVCSCTKSSMTERESESESLRSAPHAPTARLFIILKRQA